MTFNVETGAGVTDANSYASVEFADDYFTQRNNGDWIGIATDGEKEVFLVQATDYIEALFARRFIGEMTDMAQALSWPRTDAETYDHIYESDEIPIALKKATCEYAVRAIAGPLMPDPKVDETGFSMVTVRKVVGPIEKHFKVAGAAGSARLTRSYPAADALIAQLLQPGGTKVTR